MNLVNCSDHNVLNDTYLTQNHIFPFLPTVLRSIIELMKVIQCAGWCKKRASQHVFSGIVPWSHSHIVSLS